MSEIFRYEAKNYDVSVPVGETGVLPAVREARPDEIVCADRFSCRTQIDDLAGRNALHVAQVVEMALVAR